MSALWLTEWETTCSDRWAPTGGHDRNGTKLYRATVPVAPLPSPRSASVIRELEIQINGRVLSVKETP